MRPSRSALLAVLLTGISIPAAAHPAARLAALGHERTPHLQLTELFHVGSLDGRNDAFGRVMDATLDHGGRLLVADDQNHRVVVFGRDGRFVGNLGRRGSGPGEMQAPWLVAADAGDSIFVYDNALSRISVFGRDLRFARSFSVPPQWLISTVRFLPDGRLLVAAYGRNEPNTLHVLSRMGQRITSFGPRPLQRDLSGFEASLLGGNVDVNGQRIVYSVKSPYQLWFYDLNGRDRGHCSGPSGSTTDPAMVLRTSAGATALDWQRFVHSSSVFALDNGMVLNQVLDPGNDRARLDLFSADCRRLGHVPSDPPVNMRASVGTRLVGVRNLEYPEVVVYERRIVG